MSGGSVASGSVAVAVSEAGSQGETRTSHRFDFATIARLGIYVAVAGTSAAAFALRFSLVASYPGPPGSDNGYYLASLHAFLGNDVAGDGLGYPYAFLVYVWGITSVFGELPGLQIGGALLAALVPIPAFVFFRSFFRAHLAVLGAALLAFSELLSDVIGWGGVPTLLGMILGLAFLASFVRWQTSGRRIWLLAGAASFALLAGTHPFSLGFFAGAAVLVLVLLALRRSSRTTARRGAVCLGLGILLSVPFLPYYAQILLASPRIEPARTIVLTLADYGFIYDYLFREALPFWTMLVPLSILGVARLAKREAVAFAVGAALLATPLILGQTAFVLHPLRPFFDFPIGVVFGTLAFVDRIPWPTRIASLRVPRAVPHGIAAVALALAVVVVLAPAASRRLTESVDRFYVLPQDVLQTLDWIRSNVPADATVATSGPGRYGVDMQTGWLWGWWIEGYAERRSLATAQVHLLPWPSQIARAMDANRAFIGAHALQNEHFLLGDTAPFGDSGNPLIAGVTPSQGDYESLVRFADAGVRVSWTAADRSSHSTALAQFPSRQTTSSTDGRTARIAVTATNDGIAIIRTTELDGGARKAWVNYSFASSGIVGAVSTDLFPTSHSGFLAFDLGNLTLPVVRPAESTTLAAEVRVHVVNATVQGITEAPGGSGPAGIELRLASGQSTARIAFEVKNVESPAAGDDRVSSFDTRSIFHGYGVEYVVLDKGRPREMGWFTADPQQYHLAFDTPTIAIFEVLP